MVSRRSKTSVVFLIILFFIFSIITPSIYSTPLIYNQDGLGFSGSITANEVTDPEMIGYNNWPEGFIKGSSAFWGGVYDGENIWMIPRSADRIIKVNSYTGEMTGYNDWPDGFTKGSHAFWGGVYDGENIWMIPRNADRVIKVNVTTGEMTGYNNWPDGFTKGSSAFQGGVYDGVNIWMIPIDADRVIKINAKTGEMTGYDDWPEGFIKTSRAFSGGVYDGENIWMIPRDADRVIKVNPSTGEMTGYDDWPDGFTKGSRAFHGGVYDGENIWMIPNYADRVIKFNTLTGEMTGYDDWPASYTHRSNAFVGGVYDGVNIWMIPNDSNRVIKIDVATGEMTGYNSWPQGFSKNTFAFAGGVHDGTNIWMIPNGADRVIKLASSSDTRLTIISEQIESASLGGSGESAEEAITWDINVPYEEESIVLSDILVGTGATKKLYTNSNFIDEEVTEQDTVELISAGETRIYVKVIARDETTIRYYEVRINREGNSNSNLATLSTSIGTLSPVFETETKDYRVNVANSVSRIALTPTAEDENAIIKVNGKRIMSGELSQPINLHVGTNTINIDITSENNINTRNYVVAVRRQAPIEVSEGVEPEEDTIEKENISNEDNEDAEHKKDAQIVDDREIITREVREYEIIEQLNQNNRNITISPSENAENVVARIDVEMVKRIKEKEAEIEVKNDMASYRIPASEIMNDDITRQFGESTEGKNIVVDVSVKRADSRKAEKLENTSRANGFEVLANPVEFKVSVTQGEKRVEINRFNRYIERRITIPANVDINRPITGVVLEEDGTVRQVPS